MIKVCSQLGVSRFRQGDLEIEFGNPETRTTPIRGRKTKSHPVKEAEIEKDALEQAAQNIREDENDHLLLENPMEYERRLIQGELDGENLQDRRAESDLQ
jgi:hypothetical protein